MRQAEVIVPDERQTIVSRMQARMLVHALCGLVRMLRRVQRAKDKVRLVEVGSCSGRLRARTRVVVGGRLVLGLQRPDERGESGGVVVPRRCCRCALSCKERRYHVGPELRNGKNGADLASEGRIRG